MLRIYRCKEQSGSHRKKNKKPTGQEDNKMNTSINELNQTEMQNVTGGKKPTAGEGIVDFFIWAACGFHHRYVPTGKTKTDIDLVFPVKFYQVKCLDCGHISWERGELPNIQGPKINPSVTQ